MLAATGILSAVDPGAVRDWSSGDGKVIKATMIAATADSVTLKVSGTGKPVKVPLSRLSEADRAFVAEHRA
ncbi:hypothetical protein OKA05_04850 [Luteolibacter arcticus]|uniref:SLA1 homology domain-containing protein n=2 Tax=Luteolibacter arcticus TaxID=1581411 RepID=A0ABT3GEL0_9BACT|nr:hypothetical protein [Luteolibacter arcticus]